MNEIIWIGVGQCVAMFLHFILMKFNNKLKGKNSFTQRKTKNYVEQVWNEKKKTKKKQNKRAQQENIKQITNENIYFCFSIRS